MVFVLVVVTTGAGRPSSVTETVAMPLTEPKARTGTMLLLSVPSREKASGTPVQEFDVPDFSPTWVIKPGPPATPLSKAKVFVQLFVALNPMISWFRRRLCAAYVKLRLSVKSDRTRV